MDGLNSPSKFLSALQLYCSCFSVGLFSYDSRSTLLRLNRRKKYGWMEQRAAHIACRNLESLGSAGVCGPIYDQVSKVLPQLPLTVWQRTSSSSSPDFFLRSSQIRVILLSYESKTTDKQEQYDWRPEKNLGGKGTRYCEKWDIPWSIFHLIGSRYYKKGSNIKELCLKKEKYLSRPNFFSLPVVLPLIISRFVLIG